MFRRRVFRHLAVQLSLTALALPGARADNFGTLSRSQIVLQRNLPPRLQLGNRTLAVIVQPANGVPQPLLVELQSSIEGFLSKSSTPAQVVLKDPDLAILCTVTGYQQPAVTKSTENKITTWHAAGAINVSFRIVSPSNMAVLVSDNVTGAYEAQGDSSLVSMSGWHVQMKKADPEPTPAAINHEVIVSAAQQVASNVVNTTESVPVYLAKGAELDAADKYAESRLWTRDLETLETIPAQTDPKREAYRLYDIGVANEALGYAAQDRAAAVKYLQQASSDYEKALDLQSGEKFFLEPQQRIIAALKRYDRPASTREAKLNAEDAHEVSTSTPGRTPKSDAASTALTNADVVGMVQAHMDETNILDNIAHADAVKFDLSVPAQIQLTKAGLNGRELSAMKKRAQASASPAVLGQTLR